MKRLLGVAIVATLIGLISAPGFSAGSSSDQRVVREAVVTKLGPDGTPLSSLVSQLVSLRSGDGSSVELRVPKVGDLQSYRNLSGFSGPSGDSKDIVWKTTSSVTAQSLARINKKLPFEVHVRYFVNGTEVKPSEVQGKSGRLKMEIDLINASGDPKTLTYKALTSPYLTGTVDQYTPFEWAVRVTFPSKGWDGITGDRVDVAPDITGLVAAATGVLAPPLTGTQDTISLSAHSNEMSRPAVQVYAFPKINPGLLDSLQTQYEALKALYDGTGQISDNLGKLYDGTVQLVDGLEKFAGGTGQLDDGMNKIVAGVGTRNPATGKPNITLDKSGTPTTVLGAIGTISDAMTSALLPAIGRRDPKTGKAVITKDDTGTPNTLIGGIGTIADVITSTILPAIGTRDPATGRGIIIKDDKGNTTTLLGGLQSQKDTYDDKLIPGVEQAACGINGSGSFCTKAQKSANLKAGAVQIASTIGLLLNKLQTNSSLNPGFREGLIAIRDGLTQLIAALGSSSPATIGSALLQVSTGLGLVLTGLGSDPGTPGVSQALVGVQTALSALLTSLNGPAGFGNGMSGVSTAMGDLLTSVTTLKTGVTDLKTEITDTITAFGALDPTLNTDLGTMQTNADTLLAQLGDTSDATTILGKIQTTKATIDTLITKLGDTTDATTVIGAVKAVNDVIATLVTAIGTTSNAATIMGGVNAAKAGIDQVLAGIGSIADPATLIGGAQKMLTGTNQLIAGLGQTGQPPSQTVISILEQLKGGLDTALIPGLDQLGVGIHNANWDKKQPKLGGLTPHQYFSQCPGCFDPTFKAFDPRTADPKFSPGVLEVFHLFSDGIRDALPKLVSLDPKNPGLVDGLGQIADGLNTITSKLQTFDPKNPGLVDGIQLIVDGLGKLAQNLQTFDPNHPGLVDGLRLVQGGIKQLDNGAGLLHSGGQQISQGVFAINELGLRTVKGQVGDKGDEVKQDQATLAGAIEDLTHTSTLAKADHVSTTYVFNMAASSTATRDNLIRGGLLALLVALLGLLARRPKLTP